MGLKLLQEQSHRHDFSLFAVPNMQCVTSNVINDCEMNLIVLSCLRVTEKQVLHNFCPKFCTQYILYPETLKFSIISIYRYYIKVLMSLYCLYFCKNENMCCINT